MKAFSLGGLSLEDAAYTDEAFDARYGWMVKPGSSRAVRLASNSPPVHKPAGYFNRSVVDQNSAGR
jgi:hypothetical protein